MVTGGDCGIRLRHALAFASDIQRRVNVNRESARGVAASLSLCPSQTEGAARLLRSVPKVPSPERLALVAMRDHGLDNADIAEMFGRSERWAMLVRMHADELRKGEPINPDLEYLDDGLRPGDPTPWEILEMAEALRGTLRGVRASHRRFVNEIVSFGA